MRCCGLKNRRLCDRNLSAVTLYRMAQEEVCFQTDVDGRRLLLPDANNPKSLYFYIRRCCENGLECKGLDSFSNFCDQEKSN